MKVAATLYAKRVPVATLHQLPRTMLGCVSTGGYEIDASGDGLTFQLRRLLTGRRLFIEFGDKIAQREREAR